MVSERHLLYFSCLLAFFCGCLTNAQEQPAFLSHYCNFNATAGNYTSNSIFQTNLDNLTSTHFASSARFYNFSIGKNPDTVYVIALCRGDVTTETCGSCLRDANTKLRSLCPNQKQSIGWDDYCMLRYWDTPIFNTMQTLPNAYVYNVNKVSDATTSDFNLAVRNVLNRLVEEASKGTAVQKFATGNTTVGPDNNMTTIYALAECTPDLNRQQCRDCLTGTFEKLPECCNGRIGGRVLYPSCNFRYELSQFYNVTTMSDSPPVVDRSGPGPSSPPVVDKSGPRAGGVPSGAVTFPKVQKFSLILLALAMFWNKI